MLCTRAVLCCAVLESVNLPLLLLRCAYNQCHIQARSTSPFALQLASPGCPVKPLMQADSAPQQPPQSHSGPMGHPHAPHRLSREFGHGPSSMPSMPASKSVFKRHSHEGLGDTHIAGRPSDASPMVRDDLSSSRWQTSNASAWDDLIRYQSLEPTASQLSVTHTQQAMTLMGRTESIRDRMSRA